MSDAICRRKGSLRNETLVGFVGLLARWPLAAFARFVAWVKVACAISKYPGSWKLCSVQRLFDWLYETRMRNLS